MEKLNIKKASLLLSLKADIDSIAGSSGHKCSSCEFLLREQDVEVFDNLESLEKSLSIDTKMAVVYVAGYATRKHAAPSEDEMLGVTTFYPQKYGGYVDEFDRVQLNIPTDTAVQWSIFCTIMFESVKDSVCRHSLTKIFDKISSHYQFGMDTRHSQILANVNLNRFCRDSTPRSTKEARQKVIKLGKE